MYSKDFVKGVLEKVVATVEFTKVNGEKRLMKCTLQENFLPKVVKEETKKVRTENASVLSVWDVDQSEWRSFRVDSIISISF